MWSTTVLGIRRAGPLMLSLFANRAVGEIERVRADEALRTSAAQFRTLCQASPMGVFESDQRGYCSYISTQWETLTGAKRPTARIRLGIVGASGRHRPRAQVWRRAWPRGTYLDEFRIVLENGDIRWRRAMARRLGDPGSKQASYVGCIEDITDRKQAELRNTPKRATMRLHGQQPRDRLHEGRGRARVYANLPYLKRFQRGAEEVILARPITRCSTPIGAKTGVSHQRGAQRKSLRANRRGCADGRRRAASLAGLQVPVEAESASAHRRRGRRHTPARRRRSQVGRGSRRAGKAGCRATSSLTVANSRLQQEILERESADAALRAEQILLRRLLYRQEADRKLIAYEIHDGPVQYSHGRAHAFGNGAAGTERWPERSLQHGARLVAEHDYRIPTHDQRLAADVAGRIGPGAGDRMPDQRLLRPGRHPVRIPVAE